MRDFRKVASILIPERKKVHLAVFIVSILMIPGFTATLTPIDIESYNLESPELEAAEVMEKSSLEREIFGVLDCLLKTQNILELPPLK